MGAEIVQISVTTCFAFSLSSSSDNIYLEKRFTGPPRILKIRKLSAETAGDYKCRVYTKERSPSTRVVSSDEKTGSLKVQVEREWGLSRNPNLFIVNCNFYWFPGCL